MIKFIKLTEHYSNGVKKPILINVDQIASIKLAERGIDTHVCMIEGTPPRYFFVLESVEQIWEMLITDNTRSPVIMTAAEALEYYKLKDAC